MADYVTLQDAVDGLRADNQALTDEVLAGNTTATTAKADAEAARVAAELAETNAKQSETLAGQYKDGAEAAVPLAEQHKLDAEAQVPLAQTEKVAAEAARDTAVLTALGPDNDKLVAIAKVYGAPSLNLDFAKQSFWKQGTYPWNQESLDPATDLTFTRASTATYFDKNGVLQTAAADEMRFDHDPVTGEPLGVLIEESRTNYVPTSDLSARPLSGSSITQAPSTKFGGYSYRIEATESDRPGFQYNGGMPSSTGTVRSVAVRAGELDAVQLSVFNFESATTHTFNLTTGTVDQQSSGNRLGSPTIEPLGDGWFLISSTVGSSPHSSYANFRLRGMKSDGSAIVAGEGFEAALPQAESGGFYTSRIPTAGAPVTRAVDNLRLLNFHSLPYFGKNIGTFVVSALTPSVPARSSSIYGARSPLFSLSSGGVTNTLAVSSSGDATYVSARWSSTLTPANGVADYYSAGPESFVDGGRVVSAVAIDENGVVAVAGLGKVGAASPPARPDFDFLRDINFGRNASDLGHTRAVQNNCHITGFSYYPRAMTETELIELTTLPDEELTS